MTTSPTSIAIQPLEVSSASELDREFSSIHAAFEGKESEETWECRERALQRLRRLIAGSAIQQPTFFSQIKSAMDYIIASMQSLRSALTTVSCVIIQDLATRLGQQLDPLVEKLIVHLLKLCSQSKKLIVTLASQTAIAVLQHTSFHHRIFERLVEATCDKSVTVRERAVDFMKVMLEIAFLSESGGHAVMRSNITVESIERILPKMLGDANSATRERSREVYFLYQAHWPDRCLPFTETLDSTVKKSLQRARSAALSSRPATSKTTGASSRPKPSSVQPLPSSTQGQEVLSPATKTERVEMASLVSNCLLAQGDDRVALIRRICRILQQSRSPSFDGNSTSELAPDQVKRLITLLDTNADVSAIKVILEELFPLLMSKSCLEEALCDAVPYLILIAHYYPEFVASSLLERMNEGFQWDLIVESMLRCLSPNPFAVLRAGSRLRVDKDQRMAIHSQILTWLQQMYASGQEFPQSVLQTLINKLIPLCEAFSMDSVKGDLLASVLLSCYQQSPAIFESVLSTFDDSLVENLNKLLPRQMEPSNSTETAQSSFIADNEGDASFMHATMPSFGDQEMSFAIPSDLGGNENHHANMSVIMESPKIPMASIARDTTPRNKSGGGLVGTEMDLDITPKASAAVLVGEGPMQFSLTPLLKQRHATKTLLMTPASAYLAADAITPATLDRAKGAQVFHSDVNSRLTYYLNQLSQGEASDKVFRRLFRMSKEYVKVQTEPTLDPQLKASATAWQSRFPEVLDILLCFLDKSDEEIQSDALAQRENALIVIKHMYMQHRELFQGLEVALIRKSLVIRSSGEADPKHRLSNPNGSLSAIASDIFDLIVIHFDPVRMANLLIDGILQSPDESTLVGVGAQCLSKLVEERFSSMEPDHGLLPVERHVLLPLWQHNTIRRHIQTNPIVFNRKSLFDFLLALWRVMGHQLIEKYLQPSPSEEIGTQKKYGLPVPSFRLFQVLLSQEKRRLQVPR